VVCTLITGANKGLGAACVKKLEKEGHDIIGIDGRKAYDFNKKDSVYKLCEELQKYNIDNIIHCAGGGFGFNDPLIDWEHFETLFRINMLAASTINKFVVPNMITNNNKGSIIHIGSMASKQVTASVGYSAVKASVNAYVRTLARSLIEHDIRVNAILPGSFIAEGNRWYIHTKCEESWLKEYVEKTCPRGSLGNVDEVLPLIEFLLSEESRMMTGSCIPIDNAEGVYI